MPAVMKNLNRNPILFSSLALAAVIVAFLLWSPDADQSAAVSQSGPGRLPGRPDYRLQQRHKGSLTHWLLPGRTHAELLGAADGTVAGHGRTSVFKDHLLGFQGIGLLTAFKAVDLVPGSTGHRLLLANVSYE